MKSSITTVLALFVLVLLAGDVLAVDRIARRFNFMEFSFVTADPVGSYSQLGTVQIVDETGRSFDVDAGMVLNSTWGVAFSYGQIRNEIIAGAVGFRYLKVDHKLEFSGTTVNFHQVDVDFTIDIHPLKPVASIFSPYVGATVNTGLTISEFDGYQTESALTVGLSANFGFNFKVWTNETDQSFLTLASVNSYNLIASTGRPKYFQIGGGLRYWFRP